MFDSKKLYGFALAIYPHLNVELRDKISRGIDSYGMDSGEALLQFYLEYFKMDFLTQFFIGNSNEFTVSVEQKLNQYKNLRYL